MLARQKFHYEFHRCDVEKYWKWLNDAYKIAASLTDKFLLVRTVSLLYVAEQIALANRAEIFLHISADFQLGSYPFLYQSCATLVQPKCRSVRIGEVRSRKQAENRPKCATKSQLCFNTCKKTDKMTYRYVAIYFIQRD